MLKQSFSLLSLLLVIACISSCKKDDNDGPGKNGESFFSCKIDNKAYEVEGTLAYGFKFGEDYGVYGLAGTGNEEICYINIPNNLGVGTHVFDNNTWGNFTDAAKTDYSTLWGSGSGSVTIEELDAVHVKGTFQFTVYDGLTETTKKTLTDGKFDVKFR